MADPLGSLVDVIAGLVDRLEASGFPYALGGAVAYSSWGEPRATRDVDLNLWVAKRHAFRKRSTYSPRPA